MWQRSVKIWKDPLGSCKELWGYVKDLWGSRQRSLRIGQRSERFLQKSSRYSQRPSRILKDLYENLEDLGKNSEDLWGFLIKILKDLHYKKDLHADLQGSSKILKKFSPEIDRFHMTSRLACRYPNHWELNCFPVQTLSFVPVNLHSHWPHEWKCSIFKYGWNNFSSVNILTTEVDFQLSCPVFGWGIKLCRETFKWLVLYHSVLNG